MKRLLLFVGLLLTVLTVPIGGVYADVSDPLARDSYSAYLLSTDGVVLYEKAATEHHEIASMTKIMTLNIVFNEIKEGRLAFNDLVTISKNASKTGGSTMILDENSEHTVEGLIKGVAIASANDAAVALSEKVSGSEQAFVELMNSKAKEFGANDTLFANCTGLPANNQYSCAKDVSLMTMNLLRHQDYFRFANIKYEEYTHPSGRITLLANTNKLLSGYDGCDCGKTGYTDNAGHCFSASAMRDGFRVIATVIGAKDSKARFRNTSQLFNYAFANYENKCVLKSGDISERPAIAKLKNDDFKIGVMQDINVTVEKNKEVSQQISFDEGLKAPIEVGQRVGEIKISVDDEVIKTVEVVALEKIEKATFGDYIKKIASLW